MMALPRREPREVYKVYSESEFMRGADEGEMLPPAPNAGDSGWQLRRIAGPLTMAGVLLAIVAMVLVGDRPRAQPHGRPVPRVGSGPEMHAGERGPQALAPTALVPGRDRRPSAAGWRVRLGPPTRSLPAAASSLRGASRETHEPSQGPASPPENAEFGFER